MNDITSEDLEVIEARCEAAPLLHSPKGYWWDCECDRCSDIKYWEEIRKDTKDLITAYRTSLAIIEELHRPIEDDEIKQVYAHAEVFGVDIRGGLLERLIKEREETLSRIAELERCHDDVCYCGEHEYKIPTAKRCSSCIGYGYLFPDDAASDESEKCISCNGTGLIQEKGNKCS